MKVNSSEKNKSLAGYIQSQPLSRYKNISIECVRIFSNSINSRTTTRFGRHRASTTVTNREHSTHKPSYVSSVKNILCFFIIHSRDRLHNSEWKLRWLRPLDSSTRFNKRRNKVDIMKWNVKMSRRKRNKHFVDAFRLFLKILTLCNFFLLEFCFSSLGKSSSTSRKNPSVQVH